MVKWIAHCSIFVKKLITFNFVKFSFNFEVGKISPHPLSVEILKTYVWLIFK